MARKSSGMFLQFARVAVQFARVAVPTLGISASTLALISVSVMGFPPKLRAPMTNYLPPGKSHGRLSLETIRPVMGFQFELHQPRQESVRFLF